MSGYAGAFTALTLCFFLSITGPSARAEEPPPEAYVATVDAGGVQRVEMTAGSYYFRPNHIVVRSGVPVELVIKNAAWISHDFVLKAPRAGVDIKETLTWQPKTIRFTPARPGRYRFYCDIKFLFFESHRERGMEGTLEVVK